MPRIPFPEESARQTALPAARLSAAPGIEAFGGGQVAAGPARAVAGLAAQVADIAQQEMRKANELAVLDADRKMSELETRVLYAPVKLSDGKPNPKPGATNVQGKDALALPDTTIAEFDSGVSEIEKGLYNEDQRAQFRSRVALRRLEVDRQVQRHVSVQIAKYDSETTDAFLVNERDAAAYNYHDPERIAISIELQQLELARHAQRNGLPPEWVKLKTRDAESKTHLAVIDRMIAADEYEPARDYYKANAKGISGLDADGVERAIKASESSRQKDLYLEATNMVDKQPGVKPKDLLVGIWDRLSLEQRRALESRSQEVDNDDKLWISFRAMDARSLAKIDKADFEAKYWARFDPAHRERALEIWTTAKDAVAGGKGAAAFQSIRSDGDLVLSALRRAKVIPESGKLAGADAQRARLFEDKVDEAFQAFYGSTGKNPDDAQKKKIVTDLLARKVLLNEWGTDSEKPAVTLTEEEVAKAYVPLESIPIKKRAMLINLARNQGKIRPEVSDDQAALWLRPSLEKAYGAAQAGATDAQIIAIIKED